MDNAETLNSCEEQDDADETLSLSAFPLHAHHSTNSSQSNSRRSLTDQSDEGEAEVFEFLIDEDLINSSGDVMCSADDIIINGKLLPSNLVQTPASLRPHELFEESKIRNPATVSDSPAKQEPGKTAEKPGGGFEKAVVDVLRRKNAATRPRPKWQLLGVTKFPTEMELRDIKIRQLRRQQQTPATTRHVIGRQCGWNIIGSWKVFNSLSCKKDDAACSAVVANASFPPTKGRYVH